MSDQCLIEVDPKVFTVLISDEWSPQSAQQTTTNADDDENFIYHKVEGSQGSRAYMAGSFNNTAVHGFNNLVKTNIVHSTGTTKKEGAVMNFHCNVTEISCGLYDIVFEYFLIVCVHYYLVVI